LGSTSPLKSLEEGTGHTVHTTRFEEQVAGTRPKNSTWFEFVGLVTETKVWSLRLDFEEKMVCTHDGTCPHNVLQRLVAGTSPLQCADLCDNDGT